MQEKAKRQTIIMKRAVWRFVQWRRTSKSQKIIAVINSQIDKQYALRFKWRYFYLLKTFTLRSRREKELAESIQHKKAIAMKKKCLDSIITRLIMCLVYKQLQHKFNIKLKRVGLALIKQLYYIKMEDAIDDSSDDDN